MKLELRVLQPEKLSVTDCDVISMMHMQNGPDKNTSHYDELMENSYMIDDDDLEMFKDYRASIYHCFGYHLKASTVTLLEVSCNEEIEFDENRESSIMMRPICQRFADQYYSCEKFIWTGDEFIEFFKGVIKQMKKNGIEDEAVSEIEQNIIATLTQEGTFVQFCFK